MLVVASIVAGTVVLYGGALEILAIAVNQANVLRPETVVYQNTLHGFPGGWPNGTACSYGSDGYHVDGNGLCYAPSDPLSDVAVTVSVTQTGGLFTVPYGIVVRATPYVVNPSNVLAGSYFVITGTGQWAFLSCANAVNSCSPVVSYQVSDAIHLGPHASNTLKVHAQGSHYTFFINQTQVGAANDFLGPSSGAEGVVGSTNAHVVFTNFVVARVG